MGAPSNMRILENHTERLAGMEIGPEPTTDQVDEAFFFFCAIKDVEAEGLPIPEKSRGLMTREMALVAARFDVLWLFEEVHRHREGYPAGFASWSEKRKLRWFLTCAPSTDNVRHVLRLVDHDQSVVDWLATNFGKGDNEIGGWLEQLDSALEMTRCAICMGA
jgi:hypothetical protein